MKKEISIVGLAGYYPTKRSRKIRYREVTASVVIDISEVKDLPVIMECHNPDFVRFYNGTTLRGYHHHLMQPIKGKNEYCYDLNYNYNSSQLFQFHDDAEKFPYVESESIDIPDLDLPKDIKKGITITGMTAQVNRDYADCVYYDGKIWDKAKEPYIRLQSQYNFPMQTNHYWTTIQQMSDDDLNPTWDEFRLDDWWNIYSNRYAKQEDLQDDIQITVSDDYRQYLALQYNTMSNKDSQYQLDMNKLPSVEYVNQLEDNGDPVYVIRFRYDDYDNAVYNCRIQTDDCNEALAEFMRFNPHVAYDRIFSIEKETEDISK